MAALPLHEKINTKISYTFDEAIEYMKQRDKYPTTNNIHWSDAKTGKPVSIGYSGDPYAKKT